MPASIQINEKQTVRFRDYTLLFDLILVTKSEKWYRPAHVETLLPHRDTHSHAAFLTAYDTKSDEMSYTEKIRYDFSDTFNLEKILYTSLEDNPSGTIDILRNFPCMDYEQKVEAYLLMYNYVTDRIDKGKERQTVLRNAGFDPVENMRKEQHAMRQAYKELTQEKVL